MKDLIGSDCLEVCGVSPMKKTLHYFFSQAFFVKTLLRGFCRQLILATQAVVLLLTVQLMAPPAFAQIASGDQSSGGGETTKYVNDGLEVELVRLVQVIDEGEIRLILRIVDTVEPARRIAWVLPYPELSDDLGNLYVVKALSAIGVCADNSGNDTEIAKCVYGANDGWDATLSSLTALVKDASLTAVIQFVPESDNFVPDLAKEASSFPLTGTLAVLVPDLTTGLPFTIAISNIPKPE